MLSVTTFITIIDISIIVIITSHTIFKNKYCFRDSSHERAFPSSFKSGYSFMTCTKGLHPTA